MENDGISLSDGTASPVPSAQGTPGQPESAIVALSDAIADRLSDEDATTCNPGLTLPVEPRDCGETDVQGRLVNLSEDAVSCDEGAASGGGRYVHLAASEDLLGGATPLAAAMEAALSRR